MSAGVVDGLDAWFERCALHIVATQHRLTDAGDGCCGIHHLMGQHTGQPFPGFHLVLVQPEQAVLIPRGTFFQTTGGQWIFVLDKGGQKAYRRNIRIGRQNPQYFEVLEGLEPGERVVTSGYEAFKDNEVLVFK